MATISYTKNNLSAILEKVKAGETCIILDRDKPIAQITKIDTSGDARVERLIAQGKLLPPKSSKPYEPSELIDVGGVSLVEYLLEERREGR